MLYFKEIDIPYYDIIVQKSLEFVKQNELIFNHGLKHTSFYYFNMKKYLLEVPEIKLAFDQYGLMCTYAGAYVMLHQDHVKLHVDGDHHMARINLPLMNCDNTFTNFYSGCNLETWINPDINRRISVVTNPEEAKLEATVEMKKATVVRISEVHSIKLPPNPPVPRITLSLGFDKDPVFLLD